MFPLARNMDIYNSCTVEILCQGSSSSSENRGTEFQPPPPAKPGEHLPGISVEIGAQHGLSPEHPLRITHQHPAQRHSGESRAVPDGRLRDHLYGALLTTIPLGNRDGTPDGNVGIGTQTPETASGGLALHIHKPERRFRTETGRWGSKRPAMGMAVYGHQ